MRRAEVLKLTARGHSVRSIARTLGCARPTVDRDLVAIRAAADPDLRAIRSEVERRAWLIHDRAMEAKEYRAALQALRMVARVHGLERQAVEVSAPDAPPSPEHVRALARVDRLLEGVTDGRL